ncbi:uncharacterized protein PG998_011521 [Apiospora kogelbergensis]|uniref:uncharacterized protein n=1 Tax=Apiospora kogelbergensis TaxID=1337665 RepID=UPI00312E9656
MLAAIPSLLLAALASGAIIPPTKDATVEARWKPGNVPIRGVNLGSQFIIEPWMAKDEWRGMGCVDNNNNMLADEWSCVQKLGQAQANKAWKKHWETWITQADIQRIHDYKLNTIRIPVGFWIREDLVQAGEFYPRGGLSYLDRIVGWASDLGLQIIIDLHGAPGSQSYNQAFTGLQTHNPAFYTQNNFERTYKFLEWMAERIHTKNEYRNVYALQVLNEPVRSGENADQAGNMVWNFYPEAWRRIRAREAQLGTSSQNLLHIIFMGASWGSGDPASNLPGDRTFLGIDDHKYYKWDDSFRSASKQQYLDAACRDDHGTSRDTIVGEWSLGVHTDLQAQPGWAPAGATAAGSSGPGSATGSGTRAPTTGAGATTRPWLTGSSPNDATVATSISPC